MRIIVGAAPSGTYDIMARLIGEWLSERLGQPFVILPDVPTVGEFVHGYEASTWVRRRHTEGSPAEILEKLNKELLTSGSGTSRDSNRAEHVFARAFQTSTCSAMASASSTSMPR